MAMHLISHSDRAFSIESFLHSDECDQLIALAEKSGFSAAEVRTNSGPQSMPAVRNNERTLVGSPSWIEQLWQRMRMVDLPVLNGEVPLGLPKDLRFYKYLPGQRFKMHKDGPWRENGLTSKLTLLVYLNDGFSGGETEFREFIVTPAKGAALVFVHDTWHAGAEVTAGTKYVLRSDILYGASLNGD
jgi:predicted 2-oxoglutarate/Fe(II)-dependent dioxygenase YbiX